MAKSIGEQNYEHFAFRYAAQVATKPYNAFYERPATLSLLPEVKNLRVLDAGCGPGIYAEWRIEHGAEVTAVDVTPAFIEVAGQRLAGRARVIRSDLTEHLDFADNDSFDVVLSSLVLHYIKDWRPVFNEFHRVLKPGGILVFSVTHPMDDYIFYLTKISKDCNYYDTDLFEVPWKGWGEPYQIMRTYRRPLSEMLNPLVDAGFHLDRVLEPTPTEQFKEAKPEDYEIRIRQPSFLCIRAIKD